MVVEKITNNDTMKGGAVFPIKLHRILNEAEEKGFDDIVAWRPDGLSFVIRDKQRMEKEVMSLYFASDKFKSFQRSLNLWGFQKVGKMLGGHFHPLFIRDRVELCECMHRERVKKPGIRSHLKVKAVSKKTDNVIHEEPDKKQDDEGTASRFINNDSKRENVSKRVNTIDDLPSPRTHIVKTSSMMIPNEYYLPFPFGLLSASNRLTNDYFDTKEMPFFLAPETDANIWHTKRLLLAALITSSNSPIQVADTLYRQQYSAVTMLLEDLKKHCSSAGFRSSDQIYSRSSP